MDSLNLLLSEVRNALRMLEEGECGMSKEQEENAYRAIQYYKNGVSHFDESTARGCIAQMYYYDSDTHRSYAPFVSYEDVKNEYVRVGKEIPDYNLWDFAVTINLMYSNHIELVRKWTKDKGSLMGEDERVVGEFSDGRGYCPPNRQDILVHDGIVRLLREKVKEKRISL